MLRRGPWTRIFETRWDSGRLPPVPGRLISFGGLLTDLVVSVDAVPARGADVLARDFTQTVGGSREPEAAGGARGALGGGGGADDEIGAGVARCSTVHLGHEASAHEGGAEPVGRPDDIHCHESDCDTAQPTFVKWSA